MKTVRFIMALHNHQPVGNFEHVFREACDRAYHPFLDLLEEFPGIRMVLHYSGPLLEWAAKHEPALVQRIKDGVQAGRFELLGGGFGEPIFTMLSDNDLAGQVQLYRQFLSNHCGAKARGLWLPERVWEPSLAGALADASVEYTVLDDFHFRLAGRRDMEMCGYYLTEDRGRMLRVFSGSEFLRYAVPFQDPEDTIEHLRRFATDDGNNVVVYADDGEKFGVWPETHTHVYENGWLRRFLETLTGNSDWIRLSTFAETVDDLPARGSIHLPGASYREMTEWALPTEAQADFADLLDELKSDPERFERIRPFLSGGCWRNFKAKYVEAAQMYARMMEVSDLAAARAAARNIEEARRELYRGQCNCAYWHGAFGGLYLPFLRFAVYQRLLRAEGLLAGARSRPTRTIRDFDLDGRPEVKLSNKQLNCYLKPDRGGALYEMDDRLQGLNLTAVMTRRPEAYHQRLIKATRPDKTPAPDKAVSIHDAIRSKEPGLENLLVYDARARESLVDHFLPADVAPDELQGGRYLECGDFASASYDLQAPRSRAAAVTFRREGRAGPAGAETPVTLAKRISLGSGATLDIRYVLSWPEGAPDRTLFGTEFNFGLMAGNAPDRYYASHTNENLGNLSTLIRRAPAPRFALVDEWLGIEIRLHTEPAAGFMAYPVETVSGSEGGLERTYQGSAVVAFWPLAARPGEEQIFAVSLEVRQR